MTLKWHSNSSLPQLLEFIKRMGYIYYLETMLKMTLAGKSNKGKVEKNMFNFEEFRSTIRVTLNYDPP